MPLCVQCKQFKKQTVLPLPMMIFLCSQIILSLQSLLKVWLLWPFIVPTFVVLLYLRICGDNLSPSVVFSDVFLLYMACNQINVITPLANGYLKLPKKLINCQIFYSHGRYATYNILEKSTPTNSADFFTTVKTSLDPTNAKKPPFWFALAGISYK